MRRWIVLAALFLLFGGCKSGGKLVDPLVGQTRVEPPRTGAISAPADPFYRSQTSTYTAPGGSGYSYPGQSPASPTGVSPGWTPMLPNSPASPQRTLPAAPPGTNLYPSQPGNAPGTTISPGSPPLGSTTSPAVGSNYPPSAFASQPPSRITIPTGSSMPSGAVVAPASNTPSAPGPPSAGGIPAGAPSASPSQPTQPIIRTLEPRANSQPATYWASSAAVPAGGVPSSTSGLSVGSPPPPAGNSPPMGSSGGTGPSGSIDLASLPPSRSPSGIPPTTTSSAATAAGATSSGGPGGAAVGTGSGSAWAGSGGNVSVAAGPASASANPYGFDPQYQWLRGVLCYSAAEGCWRLRYVPPGCTGDRMGGWVILCHPSGLAGFCSGEQVEVRGQLIYKQIGSCQLPIYQVQDIRRTRA